MAATFTSATMVCAHVCLLSLSHHTHKVSSWFVFLEGSFSFVIREPNLNKVLLFVGDFHSCSKLNLVVVVVVVVVVVKMREYFHQVVQVGKSFQKLFLVPCDHILSILSLTSH